jgi:hypothetical protein
MLDERSVNNLNILLKKIKTMTDETPEVATPEVAVESTENVEKTQTPAE